MDILKIKLLFGRDALRIPMQEIAKLAPNFKIFKMCRVANTITLLFQKIEQIKKEALHTTAARK